MDYCHIAVNIEPAVSLLKINFPLQATPTDLL